MVSKEVLLDRVWQDTFVEESNLAQHIYRLRRTFEEYGEKGLIQTVPRRGYRFTLPVKTEQPTSLVIERRSVSSTTIEEIESPDTTILRRRFRQVFAVAAACILFAFGIGAILYGSGVFRNSGTVDSIAVFPMKVLSGDDRATVHAKALTESLVTRIGSIEGLRISYYGAETTDPENRSELIAAGRELGFDAVLESVLQQEGGEMRLWLRLLSVSDGRQIWSKTLIEDDRNIFRLQDLVAIEIASALSRDLAPGSNRQITQNREAYEAYLRGKYLLDKRRADLYERALAEFRRAVETDESFAAAYSGIASVYALQANLESGTRRDALYRASKQNSLKALELEPNSAPAHTSLAWVKRTHEWDWEGAERHFRLAIAADPNYVMARQWYALLLTSLGRLDEAQVEIEKARELEPLSRSVLANYFSVAQYRGDNARLSDIVHKITALEDDPHQQWRIRMAGAFRDLRFTEALRIFEENNVRNGGRITSDYGAMIAAISLTRIGRPDEAKTFIDHLEMRSVAQPEAAYRLAVVQAEIGKPERALELLEQCFRERDDRMVWLKVEPEFARLRNDPRFVSLLTKMGLV